MITKNRKIEKKENAKLCYMDNFFFIFYIKTEQIYVDVAKDVQMRYDTSNCKLKRPLSSAKNERVITLMKDELSRKMMTEFEALRPKMFIFL